MNQENQDKLFRLIGNVLGYESKDLTLETEFSADLNASAQEMSDLIAAVEEAFGLELSLNQPKSLTTIGQLVQLIEEI